MSALMAAAGRFRVVTRGGLRFVCHPPRLKTALLALAVYARQFVALSRTVQEAPDLLAARYWRGTLDAVLRQQPLDRAALVLATCVELPGGMPGQVEQAIQSDVDLAVDLAAACLSLCDVQELWNRSGCPAMAELPLEDAEAAEDGTDLGGSQDDLELAIYGLAERHGCSPMQVMGWPYAVFLRACDLAPVLHPPIRGAGELPTASGGLVNMDALAMQVPGIGYERG